MEVMHSIHTALLYTLEALQQVVQWEKILKLQSVDGSFASSLAATAVAYMRTGDKKCLNFLTTVVTRFEGCGKKLSSPTNFNSGPLVILANKK